jgi:hypothetical protein
MVGNHKSVSAELQQRDLLGGDTRTSIFLDADALVALHEATADV